MANVERIISLIDSYLEQNHLVRVSANDASRYLEQEGVLSYSTKGQPLCKILRSGAIPSAIQKEGKGSSWYIYHSGKSSVESSLAPAKINDSTLSNPVNFDISNPVKEGMLPFGSKQPKILILGTLPSEISLSKGEYYANPRNRFWTIMSSLLKEPQCSSYTDKEKMLMRHGIMLWDVMKEAERDGSMDVNIRDGITNDILGLLESNPIIKVIGFNGDKSQKLFQKHIVMENVPPQIRLVSLRSTSPANARFSVEQMIANWSQLFE